MSLEEKISKDLVTAMKAKDEVALRSIRAIKAAIIVAKTDGSGKPIDEAREVAIVQKLVKSRQESADIYDKNNRPELAKTEREEIEIIRRYLPTMLEGAELEAVLRKIIAEGRRHVRAGHGQSHGRSFQSIGWQSRGPRHFRNRQTSARLILSFAQHLLQTYFDEQI